MRGSWRSLVLVALGVGSARGAEPAPRPPFQVSQSAPPLSLHRTAAAGLSFTQYQRGAFRAWHARRLPAGRAEAAWQVVAAQGQGRGITAVLGRDDEFNDFYFEQFVQPDGSLQRGPRLPLDAALAARAKALGPRAEQMRRALRTATPAPGAGAAEAAAEEGLRSLTLFSVGQEEVATLCVTGAELEPRPEELAAALRAWQGPYGVVLRYWGGHHVELEAARPPRQVSELRALAWQFYLLCPAEPSGYSARNEEPGELLARLSRRRRTCSWFVE